MSSPSSLIAFQEIRNIQSRLSAAAMRLDRARDVMEVVRLHDVHVPGWLRSTVARERNALSFAAERKIDSLLDAQLKSWETADAAERSRILGQLRQDHRALCGHFPRPAQKLHHQLLALNSDPQPSWRHHQQATEHERNR